METYSIHIKAKGEHLPAIKRLARKLGLTIEANPVSKKKSLTDVLQEAESDFAAGNSTTFTADQLRALTHEVTA